MPLVFGPLQAGLVSVEGLCERSSGLCYSQDRLDQGSVSGRLCSCAGLGYRINKIISKWGQLWTGPYVWSQLIGLVSDVGDVNSSMRGPELIYVPYRYTCGPVERKDHARERVSSSDLESPLVHDCL